MIKDYVVEFFMKTKLFRMIEERENFQNIVEESVNETIKNLKEYFNSSSDVFLKRIVDSITRIREISLQTSKKRAVYDVINSMNLNSNSQKIMSFINNHFLHVCCSEQEISEEKILEILHEDN